ncbi:MAG TPA: hypothetical protein VJ823_01340 [Rhodanobacteraceae bacterium]|nr:hypothetical protein [Rhodanobacteraceae bacterium]
MNDQEERPVITVHRCGPKLTCPDGSEHNYSDSESRADGSWTVKRSKCGHCAIDDAYWL